MKRLPAAALAVVLLLAALPLYAGPSSRDPFFQRWENHQRSDGLPSDKVFAVAVDGERIWAGTDNGLALLEKGAIRTFGTDHGLPFPAVTALAVHPGSGDVWIGTMGGLARWSAGRIDAFTQLDSGLANNVIYGVAVDGTDVWVATAAGLNRLDTRHMTWEIFDTTNTLMHEPWCYAVTTADGVVYVAVWGSGVLVRDPQTETFRIHRDPDGEMELDLFRDDGLVHDVTSSVDFADGTLWIGTYFGLSRYDGRRWNSYDDQDSGLAGNFINFVRARNNVVWIATDQGLSRFDSRIWHTWRLTEPAGGFELRRTDAAQRHRDLATSGGPASNTIYGIALQDDDIWLATAAGLTHGIARKPQPSATPTRQGDEDE
jgi:ligand-binding sensor domain-containing protein